MERFIRLTIAACICLTTSCSGPMEKGDGSPPNIILIYTDDMNYDELGCFGGKVLTPTIDSLAMEGARFTRYYATSAVCTPSRFSLLTGLYPSRSIHLQKIYPDGQPNFLRWNVHLDGEKTIAHILKKHGYHTGMTGKYHNIDNESFQQNNPKDADPDDPAVKKRMENNYRSLREAIIKQTGFDYVENFYANNLHAIAIPSELQYHNMEWITAGALEFIEQSRQGPFFLYMATTIPHGPPPVSSMKADPRITPTGYLEEAPAVQPPRESVFDRVKQAGLPEQAAVYTWLDDAVAALIDKLRESGIYEQTVIILASDHSAACNGRGKMTNYEGGARTPAFIWYPEQIQSGLTIDALTANIDILPTIADLAGAEVPHEVDGLSWLPLLRGSQAEIRQDLLLEVTYAKGVVSRNWKYQAIRFPDEIQSQVNESNYTGFNQEGQQVTYDSLAGAVRVRYRAHELYPGYFDPDQLYDLNRDPGEQENLAGNPEYREQLEKMQGRLRQYLQEFPFSYGEFTED